MLKIDKKIIWGIYIALIGFIAFQKALLLLHPDSPRFLYFYFLIHFDKSFWIAFTFNAIEIIFNFIFIIPLLGYVYKWPLKNPKLWQLFFILKIIFDSIGNDLEHMDLIALYHSSPRMAALSLLQIIIFYFPAYFAAFKYCFQPTKHST